MSIFKLVKSSDAHYRRNLAFFALSYFLVLFNYPLIRASSTTLFFDSFGAKSSPVAWVWAIVFLSITIFFCNKLQSKLTVQKIFFGISVLSSGLFFISTLGFLEGYKFLSSISFVVKEIYIVLQIHLLLAYANIYFDKKDFKFIIGPVGAIGSIGAVLGGWLTTKVSASFGTPMVMWIGLVFVFIPALVFMFTTTVKKQGSDEEKSPLSSLGPGIRQYVGCIAAIIALTQFIISIADFNFNLIFESSITDSNARTGYLGQVFMYVNLVTLLLQFLVLPILLPRVSEKKFHLFIPISYFICLLIMSAGTGLIPVAMLFIYLKASDYSLFSAGKEILYQSLNSSQKYGAKYLTDMLVYRLSKALIAIVLIYLQSSTILNSMMIVFLAAWVILIIKLFRIQRNITI